MCALLKCLGRYIQQIKDPRQACDKNLQFCIEKAEGEKHRAEHEEVIEQYKVVTSTEGAINHVACNYQKENNLAG